MARNEQLVRQHRVLQILERTRFGRTLGEIRDDLVDELGLSSLHERSVRRDLEALQAAGFDIVCTTVQRGRVWKLGPSARASHPIQASATELLALSLGRELLFPLLGTPFWHGIESFWSKVREQLPESVWQHYERARRTLHVHGRPAKSYERQLGMLKTIHRAILEHRVVEIVYHPLGKPLSTRRIEPYGVIVYQSSLYIAAADHQQSGDIRSRMRHWKLDRFQKATLLDDRFPIADDFDLEQYLSGSLGIFSAAQPADFRIRLSPQAAGWIQEDPWHPQQRLEPSDDGGAVLTVQAAHELDIVPRILALGEHAEVLQPLALRHRLAEIARQLTRLYADTPPTEPAP
jgi:predicted DNA-binding transcriptional regulator YafY